MSTLLRALALLSLLVFGVTLAMAQHDMTRVWKTNTPG